LARQFCCFSALQEFEPETALITELAGSSQGNSFVKALATPKTQFYTDLLDYVAFLMVLFLYYPGLYTIYIAIQILLLK